MYNAAKAQGSAKFQRGNGAPCVFSERAALAGYSAEAVKRGEKIDMKFDRRISRRSFLSAAGVTTAALALTACGGSSSSVAASSAAGSTASSAAGTAQGGTLNIMLETEVQSLDPQVATDGTSFEVIADYTDGLMQMDADGAAIPALAETYDISEDGKTYTFHLRDAKWSNGTPVTASDFVFAWRRICKEAGEYAYMFGSSVGCVKGAQDIIDGKIASPLE